MRYDGPPLTGPQLRRFLLLFDLAAIGLRDALSPAEFAMFADVRRRLRSGREIADTLVVLGLRALGARAAESGRSDLVAFLYPAFLEVVPDEFSVWYDLANHLARLEHKDEAIAAYGEALRINPGFAWGYYNRGRLHYDLAHFDEAVADFIEAARHNCDVDGFPHSITRRIIRARGFVAMVNIVADATLPTEQRQSLARALRLAIDDAPAFDGWFLRSPPGPPRGNAQQVTTLLLHAQLADVLRDSPIESGIPFLGRGPDGYEGRIVDEAELRETLWYLPPTGPRQTVNRIEHLERLEQVLEFGLLTNALEATWAVRYASGAIALSCLMNGALDWPSPVLRLSVPGHLVAGGRGIDPSACAAVAEWIRTRGTTTVTDYALAHFRGASDDLTALALTHTEPITDTMVYVNDDGPLLTEDGDMVSRPGPVDLAESLWWFAEPVYREWVLTADHGRRPESRLSALCHGRRFNALAATELWSGLPPERWRACRELIMAAYDPDVTLADVRSAIGEGAALVDYYAYEIFGETVSQLTVTSSDATVATHEVDVTGGELRAMLEAGTPSAFPASGFAPLVDKSLMHPSAMPQTLVIVPYGYIRKIPIHALPAVLRAVDDGEVARVVYLPTASYVCQPRRTSPRPRRSLFVGYDPTGDIDLDRDLKSLRGYAGDATVLADDAATLANVLAELPRHDLAHFACHGDMDVHLAAGYLHLADARLYPWDVLDIAAPETIVMNACLGVSVNRIETTSDGALGLHDAFLVAGAQRVIGGLWEVNEWTAREFAEAFYRRLSAGDDAASATIAAQRDLRAATTDPFLWAPHAYFGEWRP